MARSDLILNLVRAATQGDQPLLQRTVDALIAEERANHHDVLANRLAESARPTQAASNGRSALRDLGAPLLLSESLPQRGLDSMILLAATRRACREVVEEYQRVDLLRSYALEPRHRVLLVGPPGNGKTSLAEALSFELSIPLYSVRYEAVVGSFLGETSSRLASVFEFVATRRCVLFFDEFDTLGKERADEHETGEVKRVVSTLLLQIDRLPSHVFVIAATNHSELLDRAAWRRFQQWLTLPPPTAVQIHEWFRAFESRSKLPRYTFRDAVVKQLVGLSFSDVENFATDVVRRYVLQEPAAGLSKIISDRLTQWTVRRGRPRTRQHARRLSAR